MISKHIKELVKENSRVIVPDFGAFMVQDTPSGKQISFNDFLKFNDGLLVNQIIKSEKIGKNEALDKIKNFVKDIEKSFSEKKSFEIKEVGFLSKDNNNTIKFESEKTEKKEEKPLEITSPPPLPINEKEKATPKEEVKKETPPPPPKVETKIPLKTTSTQKKTVIPQSLSGQTANAKPEAKRPEKSNTSNSQQIVIKENKNKTILFIIVGVVLLLGILFFVEYKFSIIGLFDSKKELTVEKTPMITKPIVTDTLPIQDTTLIEEPKVEQEEPTKVVDPNVKRYYIVAGSFRIKRNADNYNQKLISEGYKSEIVERNSGFYTVTYKTLYNWNEALSEWRNMRNVNQETWILVR